MTRAAKVASVRLSKAESRAPSARTTRKVVAALRRDGLVVFENLFPAPLLEKVRALVVRRHESGALRRRGLVRDIAGRCTSLLPFEGPLLDPRLYAHPALRDALPALLGADYRLSSLEAIVALPGCGRQHQHIDGPIRFDRAVGGARRGFGGDLSALPPFALALATPLCAVDEENGPTALWPGSHRVALRWPLPSEREVSRRFPEVRMTGPFGRSYLYDYRTFHRGLPNHSREVRPLLMLVYTRSWYRDPNLADAEPSPLIGRRELARVPASLRELFAFAPAARPAA
ncbi:MAG: phytanoyl-CoA dioxygenase family protein [Elusimicrobiota bacterium]|nr:phytanoyl-CoA dioxygenase family protein [Elusimicrobiota bacterium]